MTVYESFYVTLQARSLVRLQKALEDLVPALADDFEDEDVIAELRNLELEIAARLQRIESGDVQK